MYINPDYIPELRNKASKYMTESYFNSVNNYVNSLIDFAKELDNNKDFKNSLNNLENISIESTGSSKFGQIDFSSFLGKILIVMVVDLVRNLEYAGHTLDLRSKEGFGAFLLLMKIYGFEEDEIGYEGLSIYYDKDLISSLEDMAKQMMAFPSTDEKFILSTYLKDFGELRKKYHILMYRIISITAKCDNVVSEQETQWMAEIMKMSESTDNSKDTAVSNDANTISDNPISDLDNLIGLASVKQEVKALANLIKIQRKREDNGLKTIKPSYHCVFTGNPGTGKTTVARILAGIYKELGILKKGHLVETDRSGLVAEYVGQTAIKTNKIIDNALDGVLFIDEAYTLSNAGDEDYGKEAIATLLKRMEDDRERLIIILAGYTDEMKQFIDSNPGLQSRFSRYINFPDYGQDELMQIFESNLSKYDYSLTDEAKAKLELLFEHAIATKDKNFGNGRFVRNLFDKTIEQQSNRLAALTNVNVEQLSELLLEDIPSID